MNKTDGKQARSLVYSRMFCQRWAKPVDGQSTKVEEEPQRHASQDLVGLVVPVMGLAAIPLLVGMT